MYSFTHRLSVCICRLSLVSLIGICLSGNAFAQIAGTTQLTRETGADHASLSIQWDAAAQLQWEQVNDDRLSAMAVKTQISSSSLDQHPDLPFVFSMPDHQHWNTQMLITVHGWVPGETLVLRDKESHNTIFQFSGESKGRCMTPVFHPESTEMIWQRAKQESVHSRFEITAVYLEKRATDRERGIGFGTALPCHPNAACKTDSISRVISNAAVRIHVVMAEGSGYCTGSLVNNVRLDKTPYLLTAYHCQWNFTPFYDMWRFDFEYNSTTCENPATEPVYFSLTGCELTASGQGSDFLLVKLDDHIPLNAPVTFAGWDRNDTTTPDTSFHVHHPNADIRKFSTCTTKATIHPNQINWDEGYSTPGQHHFHFKFTEGGHEPGSSGGPVFNQKGLLIGQLHGGASGCTNQTSVFTGRFSKSWNLGNEPEGRLRDWLDPDNTGVETLPSLENTSPGDLVNIAGTILDPKGRPIRNVAIHVTGSVAQTIMTDSLGKFALNGINRTGSYTFTPEKINLPANGVNVLDVISIQKHLLGKDTLDLDWQLIAGDATNNGSINVGDILIMQRLLLGKISYFLSSPSWRFDPPFITVENLPAGLPASVELTGIKIGDVNGTADPNQ